VFPKKIEKISANTFQFDGHDGVFYQRDCQLSWIWLEMYLKAGTR
jgi:hypothetical protein